MKTFKIEYLNRKNEINKFSVNAENEKEARKQFKKDYSNMGNWANVKRILYVDDLKPGEDLNAWFSGKPQKTKKFAVSFKGRKVGAIGIFYKISEVVEAPIYSTSEDVKLKLYEKYEHISEFKINN